jgi:hypothetical protein
MSAASLQSLIGSHILSLRDQRVMLDADLAELYDVQTKVLVQAVKRNIARFPADFMFQLSVDEFANLRSQTVTSSAGHGGRRSAPYAFTEQGVAMLSSVLGSPRALAMNIEIMRTFVRVRAMAATHADLAKRLDELEQKTRALAIKHDAFSRNTRVQPKQVFGSELASNAGDEILLPLRERRWPQAGLGKRAMVLDFLASAHRYRAFPSP